ncbi:MAG: sporulation transcriptional regulator SpoIIID [Oscillospiraceae bacterium]|nr:sporulation transcriptional regulator SpoIIID [Oscillospiraceae bacterium]
MKAMPNERAAELGEYIVNNKATVRATAAKFGISKSTVHKDVSERLEKINPNLFEQVKEVLEFNKQERHIRGGEATKKKYAAVKKKNKKK